MCFCIFATLGYISLIKANIQSFDFWHENRTICAINGSNNDNPKDLTCFSVDDFSISWTFPKPEIVTNRNCKYIIRLKLINRKQWTTGLFGRRFLLSYPLKFSILDSDRYFENRLDHWKLVFCESRSRCNHFMQSADDAMFCNRRNTWAKDKHTWIRSAEGVMNYEICKSFFNLLIPYFSPP